MATKRTRSRRRRLKRGGYSRKEYELIGQSALEDEIDSLEISQYLLIALIILLLIIIIYMLIKEDREEKLGVILFFVILLIILTASYFLTRKQLNRAKSSEHTKSRIYRAGIDKVEKDKRALADAKKYKASYIDKRGRAFTLHRRKAKFSKKSRKSRK